MSLDLSCLAARRAVGDDPDATAARGTVLFDEPNHGTDTDVVGRTWTVPCYDDSDCDSEDSFGNHSCSGVRVLYTHSMVTSSDDEDEPGFAPIHPTRHPRAVSDARYSHTGRCNHTAEECHAKTIAATAGVPVGGQSLRDAFESFVTKDWPYNNMSGFLRRTAFRYFKLSHPRRGYGDTTLTKPWDTDLCHLPMKARIEDADTVVRRGFVYDAETTYGAFPLDAANDYDAYELVTDIARHCVMRLAVDKMYTGVPHNTVHTRLVVHTTRDGKDERRRFGSKNSYSLIFSTEPIHRDLLMAMLHRVIAVYRTVPGTTIARIEIYTAFMNLLD